MTISVRVAGVALFVVLLAFFTSVPEPASAEITTPTPGVSLLWTGDAEKPFSDEWAVGNAYDLNRSRGTFTTDPAWASSSRVRIVSSPVGQGSSAYAMTVRAADHDAYTSGAQRTELGQNNSRRSFPDGIDRQMYQGQERWIAHQILIPAAFPTTSGWCALTQFKGAGNGNGPLSWGWADGKLRFSKSQSQTYGSVDDAPVWVSPDPTVRDVWLRLLVHVKWSTGSDGFYEVFGDLADGQGMRQLVPLTNGWTLKLGSDGNPVSVGARFGIYRSALAQDTTAYFDGFTVATDRAAATLNAFGEPL